MRERERFEAKVDSSGDCHEWMASIGGSGYGQFYFDNRKFSSHRKAYELYVGVIPDGLFVLHTCDNKRCVNPEHLFIGTQQDNMDDKVAKKRQISGEGIQTAILSAEQVSDVRRLIRDGFTHISISNMYKVGRSTISMIANGTNWRCTQ